MRDLRLALGLSQIELAERAGVHQSSVSDLERGKALNPRFETVSAIAKALGVPAEELRSPGAAAEPVASYVTDEPPQNVRDFALAVWEELARIAAGGTPLTPAAWAGPSVPIDAESWRPIIGGIRHGRMDPVEVLDDTLAPRLLPGWLVWINPKVEPFEGCVVAAKIEGRGVFRVYETRDGTPCLIRLRPYQTTPADEAEIVGVVELVQHGP